MFVLPIKLKNGNTEKRAVYTVDEFIKGIDGFISCQDFKRLKCSPKKGIQRYYNKPITFDIETTKLPLGYSEEKQREDYFTFMYIWQMAINGYIVIGRTWGEWRKLLVAICNKLHLDDENKAIIFVHNLPYEFQFFQSRIPIKSIFARQPHKPLTVKCNEVLNGLEFHCTYSISGYSLKKVAENTINCPVDKLKGDLDYTVIRTKETQLTTQELQYCVNDVLILHYYIENLIDNEKQKNVGAIPITKTGFVRREARNFYGKDKEYRYYFDKMKLNVHQFKRYFQAFVGGDTHARAMYCDEVINDVNSYDLTSSYPYRLIDELYPASKPVTIKNPNLRTLQIIIKRGNLFIATMGLKNVRLKPNGFDTIARSKCLQLIEGITDNGRVVTAEYLKITLTSLDWQLVFRYYDFEIIEIEDIIYHYSKRLLPKKMREFVLNYYKKKTQLKGVVGSEQEYQATKELYNSIYGMCVTNPLYSEVEYSLEDYSFTIKNSDLKTMTDEYIEKGLKKFYSSKSNFNIYIVGVWTTAFARYDLHRALSKLPNRAVYWDTDSCKYFGNYDKIFNKLNRDKEKHLLALNYDIEDIAPKDIKGNRHMIGLWDKENKKPFKLFTMGAKKYCCEFPDGDTKLTVSGLNSKIAINYLLEKSEHPIYNIYDGLTIPEEYSGRTISEYVTDEHTEVINGVKCQELTYMNILETTYTFGMTELHKLYTISQKMRYEKNEPKRNDT